MSSRKRRDPAASGRAIVAACLACVVVGGAALASCKKGEGEGAGGERRGGAAPSGSGSGGRGGRGGRGNLAFAVDVIQLEAKKLDYVVTAPGTIEAFERVQVTARVAGAVDRVAFTEGQKVKKGDVLAVIDASRFQLAVNSANAALAKADASVKQNEAMVERREGASAKYPGLIPGEELDSVKTSTATAKADRAVAFEALRVAQLNLQDAWVRAPMEGVIQTRTIETGQFVQAGYVLATLLRNDPMLLRFQVEPREAPRLRPGMKAGFRLRETERDFTASITLVAAAADAETHMVGITAEVDNDGHDYWLRPGSFCDVTIDVGARRDAVIVPRVAVRGTDHGYTTYVIEGDVAREKVVTLGMSTKDGWVEVRSGLEPGQQLVVRGAESLAPGAKVRSTKIDPASLGGETAKSAPKAEPAASGSVAPSDGPPPDASAGPPPESSAPAPGRGEGAGDGPGTGRRKGRRP